MFRDTHTPTGPGCGVVVVEGLSEQRPRALARTCPIGWNGALCVCVCALSLGVGTPARGRRQLARDARRSADPSRRPRVCCARRRGPRAFGARWAGCYAAVCVVVYFFFRRRRASAGVRRWLRCVLAAACCCEWSLQRRRGALLFRVYGSGPEPAFFPQPVVVEGTHAGCAPDPNGRCGDEYGTSDENHVADGGTLVRGWTKPILGSPPAFGPFDSTPAAFVGRIKLRKNTEVSVEWVLRTSSVCLSVPPLAS